MIFSKKVLEFDQLSGKTPARRLNSNWKYRPIFSYLFIYRSFIGTVMDPSVSKIASTNSKFLSKIYSELMQML